MTSLNHNILFIFPIRINFITEFNDFIKVQQPFPEVDGANYLNDD